MHDILTDEELEQQDQQDCLNSLGNDEDYSEPWASDRVENYGPNGEPF